MDTAAQKVDSATTEDSLRAKYNISDEPDVPETEGSESAPASEPAKDTQETQPLTDEEKAERKRRNDERRERRWYEERGEMRAEMRRLQERLAEVETSRTRETPITQTNEPDFERLLKTHLESGKYKTYESALAAANKDYFDARETRLRAEVEAQTSQRDIARQVSQDRKAFEQDIAQFSKTHDDFDDVFADVTVALDWQDDKGQPIGNAVTRALIKGKNPGAVIHHLGTHPELLHELEDLLEDDEEAAAVRLGEIRASIRREEPPEKQQTTTGASRGRSTTRVAGRGSSGTTREERLVAAAEKNDFAAFQAANRAKT